MNRIQKFWERFFPPVQHLPAGVYHYQAPADAAFPYRLHLRLEPDGTGILIVNASTVLHLNQTAAEYAYHLVQGTPEAEAVAMIAKRYNVQREIIRRDYNDLVSRLKTLIDTPDLDPVAFLNFGREEPYSGTGLAPYRIDCALTYRLAEEGKGHFAPLERVTRELVSEEWQSILDKAWDAGIPHVIFTGGEPTLRPDLCQLIAYAEKLGMVSGLITGGLRLAESKYLHELLQSGLDHVMILLDPQDDQSWEALRDTLAEDIAVTVHLTVAHHDLPRFTEILDRLVKMGVQNLSLSAETLDLKDELKTLQAQVAERQLRLVWDLPVPYSQYHPVALELADEIPDVEVSITGPGKAWVYVEPDGDVLPGQGHYQEVMGNLFEQPWEAVWQNTRQPAEQK
jgi:organic radical activating enzyme